jgi:hypothetical protein
VVWRKNSVTGCSPKIGKVVLISSVTPYMLKHRRIKKDIDYMGDKIPRTSRIFKEFGKEFYGVDKLN